MQNVQQDMRKAMARKEWPVYCDVRVKCRGVRATGRVLMLAEPQGTPLWKPKKLPKEVWLILPVPPSMNHQYDPASRYSKKRGKNVAFLYGTQELKHYKKHVQAICLEERVWPYPGDVVVTIKWYRARKQGDIMERFKSMTDALQASNVENYGRGPYYNDRQIADWHVVRDDSEPKNPRVVMNVRPM